MKLRSSRVWLISLILAAVTVCLMLAYLALRNSTPPPPPPAVTVSGCRDPLPGMRRVGFHVKFDVPETGFAVDPESSSPWSDNLETPPQTVRLKTTPSITMQIAFGSQYFERKLESRWTAFSERVEERDVRYVYGPIVSRDRWGRLKTGERWRLVKFVGAEEVGYSPTPEKLARLFDQIISSACIPSGASEP